MAEVRKTAVAKLMEVSSGLEGILYSHTLEKIPPCINSEKTWYTIELTEPVKPLLIGERELNLKEGEIVEHKSEYAWRIIKILMNQDTLIYDSNFPQE